MSARTIGLMFGAFILFNIISNAFFIIDQTQQALVLRFGKPVKMVTEPGLQFKVPLVDDVEVFDRRLLTFNAEPETVILEDQDRLVVDAYVTYQVTNPLRFYQTVRTERVMNSRLENILETSLREVMGRENLSTLLSPKRSKIMDNIRDNVSRLAAGKSMVVGGKRIAPEEAGLDVPELDLVVDDTLTDNLPASDETDEASATKDRGGFGIDIVDVRIVRTDLPPETSTPIYNRMRSDRQKVAERFRAEGQKASQIIRSEADKERTILLAEANRKSELLRGEGDAEATRIFAEAFGKDIEFFEFYRGLQAYRKTLGKNDTTMILSPNHSFLKHFEQ